jgi:hypothetical protein
MDENPLIHLAGRSMEVILEAAGAGKVVEACNRLSAALESAALQPVADLPGGVRVDIHRVAALLAYLIWEEVVRWATNLNVDVRDLNERELAHLERVSSSSRNVGEPTGPVLPIATRRGSGTRSGISGIGAAEQDRP